MITDSREAFIAAMSAENDILTARYKQAHKDDPCESCGTHEGVEIMPTGGMARLTSLCAGCADNLQKVTNAYHSGWDSGFQAARQRSWWKRLFQ